MSYSKKTPQDDEVEIPTSLRTAPPTSTKDVLHSSISSLGFGLLWDHNAAVVSRPPETQVSVSKVTFTEQNTPVSTTIVTSISQQVVQSTAPSSGNAAPYLSFSRTETHPQNKEFKLYICFQSYQID